jgi:glucuronate isomerase
MLDAINETGGLPHTIVYTLNEANAAEIASIAGAFPRVRCGAAWWFCDHKRGIREEMEIIAENSAIGSFLGMLTDSRSFLSYARHDYFRRILCTLIGEWVEKGEFDANSAVTLVKRVSYENVKALTGGNV